ncbi:metalloregulator ArsR/SmtB family transcription factor [Candidatus Puniceispirillum sp.]|nr:metalloregulator ArsR/SmtB family transcription factor [Candidatus Puniceispirillum sp.]
MSNRKILLNDGEIELDRPTSRMVCIYHALSHPVRLTICKCLLEGPLSVSQICERLELKQYVASQQLAVLRNSDLVVTRRFSRNVIYSLRSEAVRRILRVSITNTKIEEGVPHSGTSNNASDVAKLDF